MLEVLVIHSCQVVVGSDINVRVNDVDDNDARRLSDLLATFDIVQHVNAPTHRCGETLDLVMTFADHALDEVSFDPFGFFLITHWSRVSYLKKSVKPRLLNVSSGSGAASTVQSCTPAPEDSPLCQPVLEDADVDGRRSVCNLRRCSAPHC